MTEAPYGPETGRFARAAHGATSHCLWKMLRIVLAVLGLGAACAPIPGRVASASSSAPSPAQIYFGLVYPEAPDITALGKDERDIGKGVSIVMWYQSWKQDGQMQAFPTAQMDAVRSHGAIPMLAWEPDEYPAGASDPQFSLIHIINGEYDSYLRQYAADVKAWGHPFFLRFGSEMNGSWVSWSDRTNGNSKGQFVSAWRHVHDIFTSVGAKNVTWVWCPNVEDYTTTPLEDLYPGNAYVDWVGLDGYNYGVWYPGAPWRSFTQVFQSTYKHLVALTPPSMPILIGETGTVENGGSKAKANWITDALTSQLPAHFPRIKALIWFNSQDGKFDLRIETSPQSLSAFRTAIASNTYQANHYGYIEQTPIPPPEQILPYRPRPTATRLPINIPSITPSVPVIVEAGLLFLFLVLVVAAVLRGGRRRRPPSRSTQYPLGRAQRPVRPPDGRSRDWRD